MYGKFLVEGDKAVRELLHSSFKIDAFMDYQLDRCPFISHITMHPVSENELLQLSTHDKPDQVIAIADIPLQEENAILGRNCT